MKRTHLRGLYSPELLESRIAPAAIVVTSLKDDGTDTAAEITLREAIGMANDQVTHPGADTITFDPALIPVNPPGPLVVSTLHATIVLTGQIDITDTLILKGPGVDKLAISGNDNSRIFDIFDSDDAVLHPTTISGLSFEHGESTDSGGAIRSTESLILKNTTFSNNYAYNAGGAIRVNTKGIVSITNTAFLNNTAYDNGGAMYARAQGGITITKSLVSGNTAPDGRGGGFYLSVSGGGLKPGHILVDGVTFLHNSAFTAGGLHADNDSVKGKITVKNSTFTGNSATENAGGLLLRDGLVTVSGSTFSDNRAGTLNPNGSVNDSGNGGAILSNDADSLTIKGSKFFRNFASEDGGGIQIEGQGLVSIAGSIFSGNKASNGGGISASGGQLTVAGNLLTGNSATDVGGGVFIINGTTMLVKGSTLSGNVAGGSGGGVYAEFGSALTFSGGIVSGNSSGSAGGGIFAAGIGADATNLTVTGTVFSGNTAAGSGGAVHAGGDGVVLIKGVKVLGNIGDDGGGMALESTSRITVSGSLFAGNHAGNIGGGLFLAGTGVRLVTGSSFLTNSADNLGGGIFVQASATAASILKSKVTGNIAGSSGGGIQGPSGIGLVPVLTGTVLKDNFASTGANLYLA